MNTVVRPENVAELPEIAAIVDEVGRVDLGGVLPRPGRTGRGARRALAATERGRLPLPRRRLPLRLHRPHRRGAVLPPRRRLAQGRTAGRGGPALRRLAERLRALLGEPRNEPRAQTKGTRDGKGIVFVAHDGDVYPAGFLPITVGNVREQSLVDLYRESPLLRDIRAARFRGRCGVRVRRPLRRLAGPRLRRVRRSARRRPGLRLPTTTSRARSAAARAGPTRPRCTSARRRPASWPSTRSSCARSRTSSAATCPARGSGSRRWSRATSSSRATATRSRRPSSNSSCRPRPRGS